MRTLNSFKPQSRQRRRGFSILHGHVDAKAMGRRMLNNCPDFLHEATKSQKAFFPETALCSYIYIYIYMYVCIYVCT